MLKWMLLLLFPISLMAQTPSPKEPRKPETRQERRERLRLQMQRQVRDSRRIIEQFLSDEMFTDMHQQFEDMMKQFDNGNADPFEQFFDDKTIEKLFGGKRGSKAFGMLGTGQSRWIETPKERILVLKIESTKDNPIDFKIEDAKITISGKVARTSNRGITSHNFKRSFNIPKDCDPAGAKFENKDGEILIKFPKIALKDRLEPVKPDSGDTTI